jgi:hypothetical protein
LLRKEPDSEISKALWSFVTAASTSSTSVITRLRASRIRFHSVSSSPRVGSIPDAGEKCELPVI